MKILDIFNSRDKKKRLSHIRNLVSLSYADGVLDQNEIDLIHRVGIKAGLSPDELKKIIAKPDSVKSIAPESYSERIEQLYDSILLMMVDTEIHDREVLVCKVIARRLGFQEDLVDQTVADVMDCISRGIDADTALKELREIHNS